MKDNEAGVSDRVDAEPITGDEAMFVVGPPMPITDSRLLPAVTAAEEAAFVSGRDLGDKHPDNVELTVDPDEPDDVVDDPAPGPGDEQPSDDEVDALVSDVDVDDVDSEGFDGADLLGIDLDAVLGQVRSGGGG